MGAITKFRGDHYFLSSMYPLEQGVITRDGVVVDSVEIGYQADKFSNPVIRDQVLMSRDGFAAKKLAKRLNAEGVTERQDWVSETKVRVMRWYVRQKFGRNPDVAEQLLGTGDAELVEGNRWHDRFWGATMETGVPQSTEEPVQLVGRNQLGILLMETRDMLAGGVDLVMAAQHANSDDVVIGAMRRWPTTTS